MEPEAVGNALADYIDAGGKVIDTLFIHDFRGWELAGRFVNESYSVFGSATADLSATPYSLGTVYNPDHPLMAGVNTLQDTPTLGTSHQAVGLIPGAVRLADWDSGEVFVAYKDAVVGINQMWYHGANWTGDVPTLMHNAILYLVRGNVDWLSVDPQSGKIVSTRQKGVSVLLDAAAPSVTKPGEYLATLNLTTDTPYGNPAVPVTMTVLPECVNIAGVHVALATPGLVYANTPVQFSAKGTPEGMGLPYDYTIEYGDGSSPATGASNENPLLFEHTYADTGRYKVEVAAWNCKMGATEAITGTITFNVIDTPYAGYLPITGKNGQLHEP